MGTLYRDVPGSSQWAPYIRIAVQQGWMNGYTDGSFRPVSYTHLDVYKRQAVKCYGANDVMEGVAIMKKEDVQCSITGNSTNPVRFQHLVAGTYKKWAIENGKKYFSVASGGGTGDVYKRQDPQRAEQVLHGGLRRYRFHR